jgi:AraC family transcriptional regulator, exoenzyme S synthesis regulatory protein ExsA
MGTVTVVGDYFLTGSLEAGTGVRLINHVTKSNVVRNKIVLQNYLFSLLVEGTKAVHAANNSIAIDSEKFLLLLSGNYLMTEKIASSDGRFQSVLIFFTQEALNVFFSKYADIIIETRKIPPEQVQIFTKDQYLKNFIDSLLLLSGNEKEIPATIQQLKLEELLLYLCYHYPEKMALLKMRANIGTMEIEIKKLVESNIGSNITIDELAFLSNLSLSTFKRKFIKLYGIAPSKWFLQRRMELATALLRTGKETPSEIYYKVGYESHSSFTHSFKQVFGLTPTEYRESILA